LIGRNAQHCISMYNVKLEELATINKKRAWSLVNQHLLINSCNVNQIVELMYVKHGYAYLPHFCAIKNNTHLEYLCTVQWSRFYFLFSYYFFVFLIVYSVRLSC